MNLTRSSGILLHPTSLPSGNLGDDAYRFVDWLARAGQSWWQVLPLGPPDDTGSPYMASSAFAAWRGLLAEPDAKVTTADVERFVERHPFWIGDWTAFAGGGAIADQVRFEREWNALRAYAADRGVRLIGDLPIYVSEGGADHRAHPELFVDGFVAGAPPDALSATGQLWGNPLYDWRTHRETGYRWWIERFRRTFELVDLVRIDHFRGFVAYWEVRAGLKTAKTGRWRRGPGRELFDSVSASLGRDLPLIAEDLGLITPAVYELRDELGLPGMTVLQFAFGGGPRSLHRPENHRENAVVYTGTHDTNTAIGWWNEDLPLALRKTTGLDPHEPHWSLIRVALGSRSRLAMIPMQDVLGLGSEARMNRPGTGKGNWQWRLNWEQLRDDLADRLRRETQAARRVTATRHTSVTDLRAPRNGARHR